MQSIYIKKKFQYFTNCAFLHNIYKKKSAHISLQMLIYGITARNTSNEAFRHLRRIKPPCDRGRFRKKSRSRRNGKTKSCAFQRRAVTHSTNRRCVASFVYPLANSVAAVIVGPGQIARPPREDPRRGLRKKEGNVKREAGKSYARVNDKPFSVYFCSLSESMCACVCVCDSHRALRVFLLLRLLPAFQLPVESPTNDARRVYTIQ